MMRNAENLLTYLGIVYLHQGFPHPVDPEFLQENMITYKKLAKQTAPLPEENRTCVFYCSSNVPNDHTNFPLEIEHVLLAFR